MSNHDYSLANQSGAAFRSDINSALAAIVSNNSGTTAPSTTFALMWWMDTTNNILKLRSAANDAWLEILKFNSTSAASTIIALGSTSANGLQVFGDANTGLYSPGADLFSIVAGGTEIFRAIYSASGTNNSYGDFRGTGAVKVPSSTTANRPSSPAAGQIRFNSDLATFEAYSGSAWLAFVSGPASAVSGNVAIFNGTSGKVIQDSGLVLASGTYTPTLTNTTNIDSSSFQFGTYQRVGDVVFVSIRVLISPTASSGALTELRITLPIARTGNFSSDTQATGNGAAAHTTTASSNQSGAVFSVDTTQLVRYRFSAQATSQMGHGINFSYTIS
jgi:hypothetical protein